MINLHVILHYLCQQYPHKDELSNARLTKMVYLADWEYARSHNAELTGITWLFDHYGPFVPDVEQAAQNDPCLEVEHTTNYYGSPKTLIKYIGPDARPPVPPHVQEILDRVIKETSQLTFSPFIQHVYSTYPIRTADRYSKLDLVLAAASERARNAEAQR